MIYDYKDNQYEKEIKLLEIWLNAVLESFTNGSKLFTYDNIITELSSFQNITGNSSNKLVKGLSIDIYDGLGEFVFAYTNNIYTDILIGILKYTIKYDYNGGNIIQNDIPLLNQYEINNFIKLLSKNLQKLYKKNLDNYIFNKKNKDNFTVKEFIDESVLFINDTNRNKDEGIIMDLFQNNDLQFNLYLRSPFSIDMIYTLLGADIINNKFIPFKIQDFDPFRFTTNSGTNDYLIENTTIQEIFLDPLLNSLNIQEQYIELKNKYLNPDQVTIRNDDISFKVKINLYYSLDNIVSNNPDNTIINDIKYNNKNFLGLIRLAFQPLAALIRFYRKEIDNFDTYDFKADQEYIASDGDTASRKSLLLFYTILNGLEKKK